MKKKWTALLLAFVLLFSVLPAAVSAKDFVVNGSFESGLSGWEENGSGAETVAYGGEGEGVYLKLASENPMYIVQTLSGLSAGGAYTFWADVMGKTNGFAVKLEYWQGEAYVSAETKEIPVTEEWVETKFDFILPENADSVRLFLRLVESGGEVCLDNVSVLPQGEEKMEPEPTQDDAYIETEKAKEAVQLLADLGIVEGRADGNFESASYLTRAEAVTVVLRLLGISATPGMSAPFTDVESDHWANARIATGTKLGIVNGVSETEFAPEMCVTDVQFIKMLVCALGYEVKARALGGYPGGYLAVAGQLGLADGITVKNDRLPRGNMAILAANSLEAPLMEVVEYGTDNPGYAEKEEKTILNTYLHVGKTEGVVNSNGYIAFSGASSVPQGFVAIDGEKYFAGETEAVQKIGRKVTAYFKEIDGEATLLHVRQRKGTEEIVLSGEDVLDKSEGNTLYYERENKEESFVLDGNTVRIFNFDLVTNIANAILTDINTRITAVLEGDTCTFLRVEQHTDYIVKNVRPDENLVTPTGSTPFTVDTSDRGVTLLDTTGKSMTLSDLKKDDVLSVVAAAGGTPMRVVVSRQSVTGEITEISDKMLTIGESEYTVDASAEGDFTFKVGDSGTYLLDAYGKIAAVTEQTAGAKYAYLVVLGMAGTGLSAKINAKLFTEDGEMKVFPAAERVRVNGTPVDAEKLLEDTRLYSGGAAVRQLIQYGQNAAEELSEIEIARDGTGMTEEAREAVFSYDVIIPKATVVNKTARVINSRYYSSPTDTKIFLVPEVYNGPQDDTSFAVLLNEKHAQKYENLYLYDVRGNVPGAYVTYGAAQTVGGGETPAIVTAVSRGLDADGNTVTFIRATNNSRQAVTLTAEEDFRVGVIDGCMTTETLGTELLPTVLRPGDIVMYSTNAASGALTNMSLVFRGETPLEIERAWTMEYESQRVPSAIDNYYPIVCSYAEAEEVYDYGYITHVPNNKAEINERIYRYHSDNEGLLLVGVFDRKTGEFTVGKYADIAEGDMVFMHRDNFYMRLMIAYRN